MAKYEVKDVVCDYGVFEDDKLMARMILNSRTNAEIIVQTLEADEKHEQIFPQKHFIELLARNIVAWETSKDKREGLLSEVSLTNKYAFEKMTGLKPTWKNLQKFVPGLGDRVTI
ncbi:MAG: hypothetical protein AB9856_01120 [Cellulosilyticaceae bacterium]